MLRRQELARDQRAGGHRSDDRNVRLLVVALAGERDTGIDDADGGDDPSLLISSCTIFAPRSLRASSSRSTSWTGGRARRRWH